MSAPAFTRFLTVTVPDPLEAEGGRSPAFTVELVADGEIPFPQLILRADRGEVLVKGDAIVALGEGRYAAHVPAGALPAGEHHVQVEGCRVLPIEHASGADWIKAHAQVRITRAVAKVTVGAVADGVKLCFGIHKHMHQPYYEAANPTYWDGEKDSIFGSRGGAYTHYIGTAIQHYEAGGLPFAGLSTSWSGSLIEQLDRCEREGLAGGRFNGWKESLKAAARAKTAGGHPRAVFSAFGFFHPLMALIPQRNIVRSIRSHRELIERTFGVPASTVLFPPETAFHVRMIPALLEAGVTSVIYDSIHRYRACRDYPYAGSREGMLPPNLADQENPAQSDWLQLNGVWAASQISPSCLRPEYIRYVDPAGEEHRIVGVPAERYIGNEDARGGYGALQYESVLGQVRDRVIADGSYDPKHPPFFLLHSDGDNYGGGTDSYYHHNTQRMVEWLAGDPRFELTTVADYLERFPPDASRAVHVEPGSWSGADNGDPQFSKWFSRYRDAYSPDLNSWAVLIGLTNAVHTLEDLDPSHPALAPASRLMETAETSCYWYWTGQSGWDQQVTNAANRAHGELSGVWSRLVAEDRTGPTIFPPWLLPEVPGSKIWGMHGNLADAPRTATLHTFIDDVSGVTVVEVVVRSSSGELVLNAYDNGPYPCQTGAVRSGRYYTATLPEGLGDVRYFVRACDGAGNWSQSSLDRTYLP